jgi:hypothetical protein
MYVIMIVEMYLNSIIFVELWVAGLKIDQENK